MNCGRWEYLKFNNNKVNTSSKIEYSSKYTQPCEAIYGNLDSLVTDELIDLCRNAKYVIIFGHAKSGKIVLANTISKRLGDRRVVSSDNSMSLGFKDSMYFLLKRIQTNDEQVIIEGIQMSRLLRKGIEMGNFYPEVVIHIDCAYETIRYGYVRCGEAHKVRQNGFLIKKWNHMIDVIFYDWYSMLTKIPEEKRPTIIKISTSINKCNI